MFHALVDKDRKIYTELSTPNLSAVKDFLISGNTDHMQIHLDNNEAIVADKGYARFEDTEHYQAANEVESVEEVPVERGSMTTPPTEPAFEASAEVEIGSEEPEKAEAPETAVDLGDVLGK